MENELDISIRQKEVLSVIASLKSVNNSRRGYNGIGPVINISRESFNDFISLLSPDEYLKGYSSGGRDIFGEHPEKYIFDNYYLSLGLGVVLELSFCETEIKGYPNSIKESALFITSFTDSQDLFIKVDSENHEVRIPNVQFEILDKDMNVIETLTTDENGEAISSKLPCIDETYYLKEISSNEFYELPNEVKEVVLTENEITDIVFENNAKTSSLQILKIDTDNTEYKIAGAVFEIFDETTNEIIATVTTDTNGSALITNLKVTHTYSIKEVKSNYKYNHLALPLLVPMLDFLMFFLFHFLPHIFQCNIHD